MPASPVVPRPSPPSAAPSEDALDNAIAVALHDVHEHCRNWHNVEGCSLCRPSVEPLRWLRSALPALLAAREDAERIDWLESQSWIHLDKTDESDNNRVGLVDSAVSLRSSHPDGPQFPRQCAATFRAAIAAARASVSPA